ncbi:hypothetical protein X768_22895 [Mesorhizobium sp. LSJC265A00]|nr:hypothetical protein X768_22895 [Mesorhizobium sp. LSJC265A00]
MKLHGTIQIKAIGPALNAVPPFDALPRPLLPLSFFQQRLWFLSRLRVASKAVTFRVWRPCSWPWRGWRTALPEINWLIGFLIVVALQIIGFPLGLAILLLVLLADRSSARVAMRFAANGREIVGDKCLGFPSWRKQARSPLGRSHRRGTRGAQTSFVSDQ